MGTKACTQMDSGPFVLQLQMMKNEMHTAECLSTDGTLDTWSYRTASNMRGADGRLDSEVELVTTQDLLWHSSKVTTTMGDDTLTSAIDITSAQHGGPSAADLDPTQFDVECTPAPTPPDVNMALLGQSHALAFLKVALQSTQQ